MKRDCRLRPNHTRRVGSVGSRMLLLCEYILALWLARALESLLFLPILIRIRKILGQCPAL